MPLRGKTDFTHMCELVASVRPSSDLGDKNYCTHSCLRGRKPDEANGVVVQRRASDHVEYAVARIAEGVVLRAQDACPARCRLRAVEGAGRGV